MIRRDAAISEMLVVPATKAAGSDSERTQCGPTGERQKAWSTAGTQRLKSLGYSIPPWILPFSPAVGR